MLTRQEYNKKLCGILNKLVDKYPDLRFGQLMACFGFVKQSSIKAMDMSLWIDEFNLESKELYDRVMSKYGV